MMQMHYFAKKLAPTPGDGQPLFTELPRRGIPGNSHSPGPVPLLASTMFPETRKGKENPRVGRRDAAPWLS